MPAPAQLPPAGARSQGTQLCQRKHAPGPMPQPPRGCAPGPRRAQFRRTAVPRSMSANLSETSLNEVDQCRCLAVRRPRFLDGEPTCATRARTVPPPHTACSSVHSRPTSRIRRWLAPSVISSCACLVSTRRKQPSCVLVDPITMGARTLTVMKPCASQRTCTLALCTSN